MKRLGLIVLALIVLAWPLARSGATPVRPEYGPADGLGGGKGQVSTGDGDEPYITQAAPPPSRMRDSEPAIGVPPGRSESVLVQWRPVEESTLQRARDVLGRIIESIIPKVGGWRSW